MSINTNKANGNDGRPGIKFLVPLDGSAMAESVLEAVELFAGCFHAAVMLLHIIEKNPPTEIHGQRHLRDIAEAEEYLKKTGSRLENAGIAVEYHVHPNKEGDVARSIVQHAEETNPGLIVICTHGSGIFHGILFGNIPQKVLQKGTWPILLVPPAVTSDKKEMRLRKILVPLDGTHQPELSLKWAIPIAGAFKAELFMTLVIPTISRLSGEQAVSGRFLPGTTRAVLDLAQKSAQDYLQKISEDCMQANLPITTSVLRGDTVPKVIEKAEEIDADLIIMTSHGRAGIDAFLSASVAPRIAGKAARPILMVRVDK
jgi:nucleotide-binding universal stress UspA family protein